MAANISNYPETPELDKLGKVAPTSQKIGEFVDWLRAEKGILLANWPTGAERNMYGEKMDYLAPVNIPIERLLAEFFGIDLNKVEEERRGVLDYLRKNG